MTSIVSAIWMGTFESVGEVGSSTPIIWAAASVASAATLALGSGLERGPELLAAAIRLRLYLREPSREEEAAVRRKPSGTLDWRIRCLEVYTRPAAMAAKTTTPATDAPMMTGVEGLEYEIGSREVFFFPAVPVAEAVSVGAER